LNTLIENLLTTSNKKVIYQKLANNIITLVLKKNEYQYTYHFKVI